MKKKQIEILLSSFNTDKLDDFKLPSLTELTGGRIFNSILMHIFDFRLFFPFYVNSTEKIKRK